MTIEHSNRSAPVLLSLGAVFVLQDRTRTVVTGSFNRVPNAAVEYAYVNEEANFSQYTKLMNGGLEIHYPESEGRPDPADIERIRTYFRDAFTSAIGGAYEVVAEPGPGVLKVRGQVIDMKMTGGGTTIDASGRFGTYSPTAN